LNAFDEALGSWSTILTFQVSPAQVPARVRRRVVEDHRDLDYDLFSGQDEGNWFVGEVFGRPHPTRCKGVGLGHKGYRGAATFIVGVDVHISEVRARGGKIVPESNGVQVVGRRPSPQVHGREREHVGEWHADGSRGLAHRVLLVDSLYRYEEVLAGIAGTVVRAVGKPDPVIDIGTRHVAREVNVVEDNKIDCGVIGLKVKGGGQRL
jgi:hypothetical protein